MCKFVKIRWENNLYGAFKVADLGNAIRKDKGAKSRARRPKIWGRKGCFWRRKCYQGKFINKHDDYVTSFTDKFEYSSLTLSYSSGSEGEVEELAMNHDEADTMLIMHGIHFSANMHPRILFSMFCHQTQSDVFVLLISFSSYLLNNTFLGCNCVWYHRSCK